MKKHKISLLFFVDALGFTILEKHPQFLKEQFPFRKSLKTIFGYSSACDPSIISGKLPQEHGHWSSFYYSPKTSPFRALRYLSFLPKEIFDRARPRHYLSKLIAKLLGFTGYFQLYALPFSVLPLFDYVEKKRMWQPHGMLQGTSLFDDLAEHNVEYYVGDQDSEIVQFKILEHEIEKQSISCAYLLLGKLDALMHSEGAESPNIEPLLTAYQHKIEHAISLAHKYYEEVSVYVFSDHGMHTVSEIFDVQASLRDAGIEWEKDYVAMFDSTMARFWFMSERAKAKTLYHLLQIPSGKIISDDELKSFGTYFPDKKFGELIFLMNPGTLIVPSFMGLHACRGMHGYHPDEPDSMAALLSQHPIPENVNVLTDLYPMWKQDLRLF